MKIFMFPYLYLAAGAEAALVSRRWETALESNTLTSYADTVALMTKQRIYPIMGWEGASKILNQWIVLLDLILGPPDLHPEVHDLSVLVDTAKEVSARLRAQSHQQPDTLSALIHLIQTEFNESFRQVFVIPLPVRWSHFAPLVRNLTTGHFRASSVSIPGGFKDLKSPPQKTRHQQQGNPAPPAAPRTGDSRCSIGARPVQVQEHNPAPNPQLQVGPGFNLRLVMDMAAGSFGYPVPLTDDGRPFCLIFHLEGVCNSHCGGRQAHWWITARGNGTLVGWKARYCATISPPPVQDITPPPWSNAGSTGGTSWSTTSRRSRRGGSG